jgi:hypothetical protein
MSQDRYKHMKELNGLMGSHLFSLDNCLSNDSWDKQTINKTCTFLLPYIDILLIDHCLTSCEYSMSAISWDRSLLSISKDETVMMEEWDNCGYYLLTTTAQNNDIISVTFFISLLISISCWKVVGQLCTDDEIWYWQIDGSELNIVALLCRTMPLDTF